jgi:endonuclease YncB( thermonuclease family)
VILTLEKQTTTLNEQLLQKGYAKLDKSYKLKEELNSWVQLESKAQDKKLAIWKYDDDEEDFY